MGAALGLFTALAVDQDGDALPDAWESQFFGDPTAAMASNDSDGDGANNLAEFVAETNPTNGQSRLQIVNAAVTGQVVSFAFHGAPGRAYEVQGVRTLGEAWATRASFLGSGGTINFQEPADGGLHFYRVGVSLAAGFILAPDSPRLPNGAISLPDAVAGSAYLAEVAPCPVTAGPYTLQVSGSPPVGLSALVLDNNSAFALVRVTASGAGLTAGARAQFTVVGTGGTNNSTTNLYDVRVIAPPPELVSTFVDGEAGVPVNASLVASNGTAPLTWTLAGGSLPAGMALSTGGVLSGTPAADSAEWNEDGLHAVQVRLTDSHTDRLTGAPTPRSVTREVVLRIRLSYPFNIYAHRPNGPSFASRCVGCHGEFFPPNLAEASAIIDGSSNPDNLCSDRYYILRGNPLGSLIYQKLSNPDCGSQMPQGGPFLDSTELARLHRWITELGGVPD